MMNKTLRVLQVVDSLEAGGIQSFVLNINKNIDLDKIRFDYLVNRPIENAEFYDKSVEEMGGEIICLTNNKGIKRIKSFIELYKLQKDKKYDIVHIHGDRAKSFFEAISLKLCKTPIIIMHSHNSRMNKDKKFYYIHLGVQKIIKHFWRFVVNYEFACSNNAAKWMFSKSDLKNSRVKIINNGIYEKKFIYNEKIREKYRKKLNIERKFVIAHIGRFSYQKNHEFLIDIFKSVHEQHTDSILLLIGVGELEETIREKVRYLNLDNSVVFYGLCDEIHNILQAMDIFVFPSHYEGLPVTGIEVQASALMTIASDNIADEIKITDYWRSVSLNTSSKEWADIILKYKDGYARKNTSKKIINAGFSIIEISKMLEDLYINDTKNLKNISQEFNAHNI